MMTDPLGTTVPVTSSDTVVSDGSTCTGRADHESSDHSNPCPRESITETRGASDRPTILEMPLPTQPASEQSPGIYSQGYNIDLVLRGVVREPGTSELSPNGETDLHSPLFPENVVKALILAILLGVVVDFVLACRYAWLGAYRHFVLTASIWIFSAVAVYWGFNKRM